MLSKESASSALSMPEALSVGAAFLSSEGSSKPERSSPRAFFGVTFVFDGFEGNEASSSASNAAFSARFRSASSFFAVAASLPDHCEC